MLPDLRWFLLVFFVLLVLGFAIFVFTLLRFFHRDDGRRPASEPTCLRCGYSLRGHLLHDKFDEKRCPECGTYFNDIPDWIATRRDPEPDEK